MFYSQYGRAPIHWAASRGNVEIINLLIEAKCDIEAVDKVTLKQAHTTKCTCPVIIGTITARFILYHESKKEKSLIALK